MSNTEKAKSARQRAQELGLGVFQICEALHMSNVGSSDPLTTEKEVLYIDILESYIEEWKDYNSTLLYDTAVKNLINCTLYQTYNL
jgi:hypothetical protein